MTDSHSLSMKTTKEFQDRVKFYERQRGLSFRDSMQSTLNEFIEEERERCARIAEQHIIPGHAIGEPLPVAIAYKIRSGT